LNQEFDFTELSYDIKVYRVVSKSKYGNNNLSIGNETLCYQVEIFNLNEPWVIYKHTYPIKKPSVGCEDPVTITSHVFNLVNHPYDVVDQDGNVRNQLQQRHNAKYKALFQRYIDNQLILFIQEEKFPSIVKFCLSEPCSNLVWRFQHEPISEIVRPAHFSIIDKGSIEGLLTCILDSVQPEPQIVSKDIVRDSGNWASIATPLFFVRDEVLTDKLVLSVCKRRDQLCIQIAKNVGRVSQSKQNALLGKMLEKADGGKSTNLDYASQEGGVLLEICLEDVRENVMISKIINQDDSDVTTHSDSLFIMVNTRDEKFSIVVTLLASMNPIFAFEFTHIKGDDSQLEQEPGSPDRRGSIGMRPCPLKKNKPFSSYGRQVKEALAQLNTNHMVE
jgi:hypothetical protein